MKVVHITTGYNHGGAAIACKRLVEAQRSIGIDARVITQEPGDFPEYIYSTTKSAFKKKMNFIRLAWEKFTFLFYEKSKDGRFQYSLANTGENIVNHPILREADIIHLHWVNGGFISLKGLKRIINTGKPIVWTMHDIWAFTGGCHIAGDCKNYTDICNGCFYLKSNLKDRISSRQQSLKKNIYGFGNIFFIAPSKWQLNRARSSSLLVKQNIKMIHNPINIVEDLPTKRYCRNRLLLPENKKLILFGAFNTKARHKGMDFLIEALGQLKGISDTELLIFGKTSDDIKKIPLEVNNLGYISGEEQMRMAYRAADLFVTPSIEDNLPNTVLESFICGTPVVAFQTGGIPEIIDHKKNGYLAEYKNSKQLAEGIIWCLENNNAQEFERNTIQKIQSCFENNIIAAKFEKFYQKILAVH